MPKVSKKRQSKILKNCRQQFYRYPDDDDEDLDKKIVQTTNCESSDHISVDHNYFSEKNFGGPLL